MKAGEMESDFWQVLRDWWGFAAFVLTGIISYIAGRERQRFRIDDLGRKVEAQEKRLKTLEEQGRAEAISLAELRSSQAAILQALSEIRQDIRDMKK